MDSLGSRYLGLPQVPFGLTEPVPGAIPHTHEISTELMERFLLSLPLSSRGAADPAAGWGTRRLAS